MIPQLIKTFEKHNNAILKYLHVIVNPFQETYIVDWKKKKEKQSMTSIPLVSLAIQVFFILKIERIKITRQTGNLYDMKSRYACLEYYEILLNIKTKLKIMEKCTFMPKLKIKTFT